LAPNNGGGAASSVTVPQEEKTASDSRIHKKDRLAFVQFSATHVKAPEHVSKLTMLVL
jgi:hypothetical protein